MRTFATNDSRENVDELMHHIRETVARRREVRSEKSPESLDSRTLPASARVSANGRNVGEIQPEFLCKPSNEYDVTDFLKYHGSAFVRNAYLGLLRREPDATGHRRYTEALATGRLNKIDVLAKLRYSAEGKQIGVQVTGLALPAFVRKLERLPMVGYFLTWLIAVGRLPVLHQHLRQSEFYLVEQQTNLARALERFNRLLSESTAELDGAISRHEQLLDSAQARQLDTEQQVLNIRDAIAASSEQLGNQLSDLSASHEMLKKEIAAAADKSSATQESLRTHAQAVAGLRSDLATQQKYYAVLRRQLQTTRGRPAEDDATWDGSSDDADELMSRPLDELYAAFEDKFRGDREEIKERLKVYLPILRNAGITGRVLDIGCGRGEWLELLRAENIEAYGVDHNRIFVDRCHQLALTVERADTLAHLHSLPDQSLSFVSAFHVVEHLPFQDLITMLDQIYRTLAPGGGVALETPNPENFMVGCHTFYTDPTHRNPIPSATLKFLLESRGFGETTVMKLREWKAAQLDETSELVKRFNEYFYCAPDYAVVGWKR